MMKLLDKLERIFHGRALPHLTLGLLVGQIALYLLGLAGGLDLTEALLIPARVLQGEVWRLFTFMLYPPAAHPLFVIFVWYFFYLMGTSLEAYWGDFRYNVYLLVGWAATVAVSFLYPEGGYDNGLILSSVFLAFAYLNPNFEILLFFILPVRIKWLALLTWIFYGWSVLVGPWPARLMVLAAVSNFFLFFGGEIFWRMRMGRRRMSYDARRFSESSRKGEYFHRCTTCGKTDQTHPEMTFRYCAKCGGLGYCEEHINNHIHVAPDQPAAGKS